MLRGGPFNFKVPTCFENQISLELAFYPKLFCNDKGVVETNRKVTLENEMSHTKSVRPEGIFLVLIGTMTTKGGLDLYDFIDSTHQE